MTAPQVSPEMWAALGRFLELAHSMGPSVYEQARGVYEVLKASPVVPHVWTRSSCHCHPDVKSWLCVDLVAPGAALCISIHGDPLESFCSRAWPLEREVRCLSEFGADDLRWLMVNREVNDD